MPKKLLITGATGNVGRETIKALKITYRDPSIIRFLIRKKREGLKLKFIIVMIGLYTIAKLGKAEGTTKELEKLLGREPISFTQFVDEYKNVWN